MTDQQIAVPCSLRFTEEMKGYVTLGETDYHVGFREGRKSGSFLMFHLTIVLDDVDAFVADRSHKASASGWVQCEQLGGQLPVHRGVFNLFVEGDDGSRTTMLYRLFFADGSGQLLTLTGFKDVKDDPGFDVWQDTSTLYVKILKGHVEAGGDEDAEAAGGMVAAGILNIYLLDFLQQLTTFRVDGPGLKERASAFGAFGRLFLGKLWDLYRGRAEAAAGVE